VNAGPTPEELLLGKAQRMNTWLILGQTLGERWRWRLEFREHQGGQSESVGIGQPPTVVSETPTESASRQFREHQVRVVWETPPWIGPLRMDWRGLLVVCSLDFGEHVNTISMGRPEGTDYTVGSSSDPA
jgi:hypothetical protein